MDAASSLDLASVADGTTEIDMVINGVFEARRLCDSVGGVVECAAIGLPIGVGEPLFEGIESALARILFAIPAVKGVEFGCGSV